jgi:hypothetical protein
VTRTKAALFASMVAIATGLSVAPAVAGMDGISRLIAVTQMKSATANDDALTGAEKQSDLIKKQKQLRDSQKQLELLRSPGSTGHAFEGVPGCDVCAEPQP